MISIRKNSKLRQNQTPKHKKDSIKTYDEINDIFNTKESPRNLILVGAILFASGFAVAWVFYKLLILSLIFGFASIYFIKFYKKTFKMKLQNCIEDEFYDINTLLIGELESGLPINMAVNQIRNEIHHSPIYKFKYMETELDAWNRKMQMGMKIEDVINDFALRSKNKSLIEYGNLVKTCSQKGGKIKDVILNTNKILNEKRQLKRDIEVMIAEKKLEQKVMNIMPLAVLLMLQKSAPEFITPLYTCIAGRITMTFLLIVFIISYLWSAKLASLE